MCRVLLEKQCRKKDQDKQKPQTKQTERLRECSSHRERALRALFLYFILFLFGIYPETNESWLIMHVFREGCPAALTTHWTHTLPRACSQSLPSVKGIFHSEMKTHPHLVSKPKCCYIFLRNEKTVKNCLSALTIIISIMTVHSDRRLTRYKKEKHYKSGPDGTTFKLFMWGKDTNWNYYSQIILPSLKEHI